MNKWCKLPTWWFRTPGLKIFRGGEHAGTSIAALKCLMAISTIIDFHSRSVSVSLTGLESATGLSRPMVVKGIRFLDEHQIINVRRDKHVHTYELTTKPDDDKWAKLPYDMVRRHLPEMLNRGVVPLTALKIYLTLAAIRPNESPKVAIGYDKLCEYTGMQRKNIRSALDILYSRSLVRLNPVKDDSKNQTYNEYTIIGLK